MLGPLFPFRAPGFDVRPAPRIFAALHRVTLRPHTVYRQSAGRVSGVPRVRPMQAHLLTRPDGQGVRKNKSPQGLVIRGSSS